MNRGQPPSSPVATEVHAEEHPTYRQTRSAQNQREGQAIPLREMPETQPQACEAFGTVVLPEVSC